MSTGGGVWGYVMLYVGVWKKMERSAGYSWTVVHMIYVWTRAWSISWSKLGGMM